MGTAEVSPVVLRSPAIRRLDYECRFALIALMAAADPKGRFIWSYARLAESVLPDDPGARILFSRMLVAAEDAGIIRRYVVGSVEYGEIILHILLTACQFGYRRTNRAARYPGPMIEKSAADAVAPPSDELRILGGFQLFWSAYPFHDNRARAKLAWRALMHGEVSVEQVERAHLNYRLVCHEAIAKGAEFPRIGASAFLSEAWVGYIEGAVDGA